MDENLAQDADLCISTNLREDREYRQTTDTTGRGCGMPWVCCPEVVEYSLTRLSSWCHVERKPAERMQLHTRDVVAMYVSVGASLTREGVTTLGLP